MDLLMLLLRWCLLIAILGGFTYVIHRHGHIHVYFIPVTVLTAIGVLVYLAGLLGQMLIVSYVIAGLGCLAFLYCIHGLTTRKPSFQSFSLIHFLFAIGLLIFMAQLFETQLSHYDNYSHWAVVVKEMLITNAFPTAESALIEFYNYPLGTASLIYFVCTVVGNQESTMLIAQGLLIFSCFYALFGVIEEKKRFLLPLVLATACSVLSYFNITIRINTLLVDFVLPVLALAAIALIYRYRANISQGIWCLAPILGFLMIVKSTGVIFAFVPLCYLLYVGVKYRHQGGRTVVTEVGAIQVYSRDSGGFLLVKSILPLLLSFLPMALWYLHMHLNFAQVENKFDVSLDVLSNTSKSPEEIEAIVHLFLAQFTDFSLRPTIGLVFFTLVGLVAWLIGKLVLKKKWAIGKVTLASLLFVALYYAGILAMYIYSMPLAEAIGLDGFERYAASIIILYGGILSICLTVDIEHSFRYQVGDGDGSRAFASITTKNLYNSACSLCALVTFLVLSSEYSGTAYYNEMYYADSLPATMQEVVGDNWDETVSQDRYLLFASDEEEQVTNYFIHYVGRYYLRAANVDAICLFYEDNLLNLLSQYDYLVIVESSEEEVELLSRYFGVDGKPGIYETAELLAQVTE